jgi:thioredoxin reductase (NADPH)
MKDITIIGAGPAGVTAAVYAVRAGMSVNLIESDMVGGQTITTPEIENFPPFTSISGFDFASQMLSNLEKFKVDVYYSLVKKIEKSDGAFKIVTDSSELISKAVIIANGAKRRKLHCKGEEQFSGRGISWCAVCDGSFFKNKITAVNGGGNSALEDALYLSDICEKVYIVHRRNEFRAPEFLTEKIKAKNNIEILTPYVISEISGDDKVRKIILTNSQDPSDKREISIDGLFEAIGLEPDNKIFNDLIKLDKYGYIITNSDCHTSADGIFAAGDTRSKNLRQIATAVSDGATAAMQAYEYIKNI